MVYDRLIESRLLFRENNTFSEPAEDSANSSISACDETNSKDENSAGPIESPLGKNDYDFCFVSKCFHILEF